MTFSKTSNPKKAISLAGGVFAVATGIRDLRKATGGDRLALVHALLKITVALVGVVVALRAVDEIADEA